MKNLYLIARDTESAEDGKEYIELNLYTRNKYPHFEEIPYKDGEKEWTHSSFQFEMAAEEVQEEEIIQLALTFAKIYGWKGIDVWKKEINDQDGYEIGVYIEVNEKGIPIDYEIFLGFADNWNVPFDELINKMKISQ